MFTILFDYVLLKVGSHFLVLIDLFFILYDKCRSTCITIGRLNCLYF